VAESTLRERIYVVIPLSRAPALLEHFLASRVPPQSHTARLQLNVPNLPVELQRTVATTFERVGPASGWNDTVRVTWHPEGGGPFPDFEGTLKIVPDEDYSACWLALDGTYVPPGGIAGRLFDVAVGSRIAHATGRELLEQIKAEVEATFDREEREKMRPGSG
jgi:hypothetical protein